MNRKGAKVAKSPETWCEEEIPSPLCALCALRGSLICLVVQGRPGVLHRQRRRFYLTLGPAAVFFIAMSQAVRQMGRGGLRFLVMEVQQKTVDTDPLPGLG